MTKINKLLMVRESAIIKLGVGLGEAIPTLKGCKSRREYLINLK